MALRVLVRLKKWAQAIKQDLHALYLATRDPRIPWYVKATALFIVGYALSPIDLIPDFVPVLGYLDDIVIVPLGVLLVVKMIPDNLMAEYRAAATRAEKRPRCVVAAFVIVAVWIVLSTACLWLAYRSFSV